MVYLLQRGWPEGRADDSPAPRTSLIIANVRAALRPYLRSVSPGRSGLPRLRAQRLARTEEVRIHVRSLRGGHESFHRSAWAHALYALYAGLWRAGRLSHGAGAPGSHRGS